MSPESPSLLREYAELCVEGTEEFLQVLRRL
jgi:hypothetical protein